MLFSRNALRLLLFYAKNIKPEPFLNKTYIVFIIFHQVDFGLVKKSPFDIMPFTHDNQQSCHGVNVAWQGGKCFRPVPWQMNKCGQYVPVSQKRLSYWA